MRQLKIGPSFTNRESKSIEEYLLEISRIPLLTSEQEVALSAAIRKGDEQALEELTKANLRFVVSVAKQYQGQGLELVDLINEGNLGLITAAKKFDETRGFKFISFAVWWIRQSILQALADHSRIVRLPLNQIGTAGKISRFQQQFVQAHERQASQEEIAEALGVETQKLSEAIISPSKHVSMDAPMSDDEGACLLDLLSLRESPETDRELVTESLKEEVERALERLPKREGQILRMYFGIHSPELSLEEIGERMNLSRERVRQIKGKALALLRSAQEGSILRTYL